MRIIIFRAAPRDILCYGIVSLSAEVTMMHFPQRKAASIIVGECNETIDELTFTSSR
jgi:hypothetical protein